MVIFGSTTASEQRVSVASFQFTSTLFTTNYTFQDAGCNGTLAVTVARIMNGQNEILREILSDLFSTEKSNVAVHDG